MAPSNISLLEYDKFNAWNQFVVNNSNATFFHLAQWKNVLQRAFRAEPFYLYAHNKDKLTGILPLALVYRPLFGEVLISTPFCVYGGAVSDDPDTVLYLENAAMELARQHKVKYLELRYINPTRHDWPVNTDYYKFGKPLSSDNEENFRSIPKRRRAEIRKSMSEKFECESDKGINRFFEIYARSLRDIGTPVYPRRYFEILYDVFNEEIEILVISKNNRDICSLLSFYFGNQVHLYYIGGLPAARSLRAYDFVIWEQMKRACNRGMNYFDLGRSIIGTGSYASKKTWGIDPVPLNYQYYLVRAKEMPRINPLNPRYRPFIRVWKRLPLPVANYIGPVFSRIIA